MTSLGKWRSVALMSRSRYSEEQTRDLRLRSPSRSESLKPDACKRVYLHMAIQHQHIFDLHVPLH
jgi:hypothetical protein